MKEYLDLCLQGKITIPTRKILLDKKKESLELTEKELEDNQVKSLMSVIL